ncbi:hypothetical protein [Priestia megaterium]|uniref:hypothetical protein n=1 Tax=Priestia megaterium TaxID=1404 RepID=UPI0015AF8A30|nr:hypothetical protein [Priestia megaterium]QLC85417.1 hypothetical protein HW576_02305 [Priestia megaterium]
MTNQEYTQLLRETYPNVNIKPVENYISPQAVISHYCDGCNKVWFDKPHNLINLNGTILRHECESSVFDRIGTAGRSHRMTIKRKLAEKDNNEIELIANGVQLLSVGYSAYEISEYLGVSSQQLTWWGQHLGIELKDKGVHTTVRNKDKKLEDIREILRLAREVTKLLEEQGEQEVEENNTGD